MDISIAEAHNRLTYWIKQLHNGPIVITRRGKPVGVIIDPIEYEGLRKVQAYLELVRLSQELRDNSLTATELQQASRAELEGSQ